jgi:hypothetical protein
MKSCSDEDSNTGDRRKMPLPWILRRYRDGDEHAIFELLSTAFGERKWHSFEYWKWKYTKNPAGSPIIWLAESNNKIVGHYAIVPRIMKLGNAYMTGSSACDAATHPNYQGRGVFSSIVNRLCLDAGENGISIIYGFARRNLGPTYKRYEHMGHICFLRHMVRVLDWASLLPEFMHTKFLTRATGAAPRIHRQRSQDAGLTVRAIDRFDERTDELWEQLSHSFKIIVKRDQSYLNWRYTANPEKRYTIHVALKGDRILGYCVLTQEQWRKLALGVIVDILGTQDHQNAVGCLIDNAVGYFEQQGVSGITSLMSEQHPYASLFRKAGFIVFPRRTAALYAAVNLPGSAIDEKEIYSQALLLSQNRLLKEKSNWFMMSGDSDWPL